MSERSSRAALAEVDPERLVFRCAQACRLVEHSSCAYWDGARGRRGAPGALGGLPLPPLAVGCMCWIEIAPEAESAPA